MDAIHRWMRSIDRCDPSMGANQPWGSYQELLGVIPGLIKGHSRGVLGLLWLCFGVILVVFLGDSQGVLGMFRTFFGAVYKP